MEEPLILALALGFFAAIILLPLCNLYLTKNRGTTKRSNSAPCAWSWTSGDVRQSPPNPPRPRRLKYAKCLSLLLAPSQRPCLCPSQ